MSSSVLLQQVASTNPEVSKASAVIGRQVEQLTRILDDLLDISRMTAGKLTLQRTNLDLAALARRCFDELAGRQLFERHRHELRLETTNVSGDSVRLEQVLTNLLTNAVKYTPAGGTISVEVRPEGGQALLHVWDTGVGISPDLLPRVFNLFVQDESTLDRGDGGLGVGLSIVRRLVEAHGGRVIAESAGLNQGARFVVRLPLAARPVEQSDRLILAAALRPSGESWWWTTTPIHARPWSFCSGGSATNPTRPRTGRAGSSPPLACARTSFWSTSACRASTASSSLAGSGPPARPCASSP